MVPELCNSVSGGVFSTWNRGHGGDGK